MCHKPFETEMERIKVLSDLRTYECILPMEYLKSAEPNQKHIIRLLVLGYHFIIYFYGCLIL